MFDRVKKGVRRVVADFKQNRFAQSVALLSVSGAAAAQTGGTTFDTTAALAAIAAGVAAGLLVSAAMTGGEISMKASKLPRKGA